MSQSLFLGACNTAEAFLLADGSFEWHLADHSQQKSSGSCPIPTGREPITAGPNGLRVPPHPIIPFIEGDGIGPDVWRAARTVLDAAVHRAYGGTRSIALGWRSTRAPRRRL